MTKAKMINIPVHKRIDGDLSIIEWSKEYDFPIKRTYYIYNFNGEERGHHAHKKQTQFIVAINGFFEIELTKNGKTSHFQLDSKTKGLLIPPGHWLVLKKPSLDAICLVHSSHEYDESEYIRAREDFYKWELSNES